MQLNQVTHPSGAELYSFFSDEPAEHLSVEERKRIALHVLMCEECARLGKIVEKNEQKWDALMDQPETPESKAAAKESSSWFRNYVRTGKKKD